MHYSNIRLIIQICTEIFWIFIGTLTIFISELSSERALLKVKGFWVIEVWINLISFNAPVKSANNYKELDNKYIFD